MGHKGHPAWPAVWESTSRGPKLDPPHWERLRDPLPSTSVTHMNPGHRSGQDSGARCNAPPGTADLMHQTPTHRAGTPCPPGLPAQGADVEAVHTRDYLNLTLRIPSGAWGTSVWEAEVRGVRNRVP